MTVAWAPAPSSLAASRLCRLGQNVRGPTTATIADANTWTKADWFLPDEAGDPRKEGGLDYWVICDAQRAYLFFTSLNGKLWRTWTKLEEINASTNPSSLNF